MRVNKIIEAMRELDKADSSATSPDARAAAVDKFLGGMRKMLTYPVVPLKNAWPPACWRCGIDKGPVLLGVSEFEQDAGKAPHFSSRGWCTDWDGRQLLYCKICGQVFAYPVEVVALTEAMRRAEAHGDDSIVSLGDGWVVVPLQPPGGEAAGGT